MEQQIFSVFDSAASRYLQPFVAPTVEVAIREFRRIVNDPNHQFGQYPEDYTLFHLGTFNQESGALVSFNTPHALGVAVTYLQQPQMEAL